MSKEVIVVDLNEKQEYQRILGGAPQTCGMRSGRVFLKAGESCGIHSTNAREELLVFLDGAGEALIGEEQQVHQVCRGKAVYIPPHTVHDIKNMTSEPLVYIYCVAETCGEGMEK